jgi:hypothetical protein
MKKFHTLIFIASLFIAATTAAQINKGATFLGGDFSFGGGNQKRNGTELTSWTNIGFSPVFGKAIRQNLILGGDVMFGYSRNKTAPGTQSNMYTYGLGAFLRKYGQLGKSGFSLFLQPRLGATHQREGVSSNSYRAISILLSAYPGLSYRVNRKLQLETGFNNLVSLGYSRSKRTTGTITPLTEISTNFGVSSSLNNISELYAGFRLLIN